MKITPVLETKLRRTFNSFRCDDCDGYATREQSPSNPTGEPCETCSQTGFIIDGSTLNDLESAITRTINEYIKEHGTQETLEKQIKLLTTTL